MAETEFKEKDGKHARRVLRIVDDYVRTRVKAWGVQKVIANEEVWNVIARSVDILRKMGLDEPFIAEELGEQFPRQVRIAGSLFGTFWLEPGPDADHRVGGRPYMGEGMVSVAMRYNEPRFRPDRMMHSGWRLDADDIKERDDDEDVLFQEEMAEYMLAGLHAFVWTRAKTNGVESAVTDERIASRIAAYYRFRMERRGQGELIAKELTRTLYPVVKVVWDAVAAGWHIAAADSADVIGPIYRTPRQRKFMADRMREGAMVN